jgi:hypothetical protein
MSYTKFAKASIVTSDCEELPHVTTTLMSNYNISQWYIARISYRSNYKCNAQQAATNVRCTAWITKGSKGTLAPIYNGRKIQYGGNRDIGTNFRFYPDDIQRCTKQGCQADRRERGQWLLGRP